MSVINKMLQDLASRQGQPSDVAPLPPLTPTMPPAKRRYGAIFSLLFIIVLVVLYLQYSTGSDSKDGQVLDAPAAAEPEIAEAARVTLVSVENVSESSDSAASSDITANLPSAEMLMEQPEGLSVKSSAVVKPSQMDKPSQMAKPEQLTAAETPVIAKVKPAPPSYTDTTGTAKVSEPPVSTKEVPTLVSAPTAQALNIEVLPQQRLAAQMEQAAAAVGRQDWTQALYLLNTDANVVDYPPLFALKAAVLQQLQQWSEALALYQQLLLVEPLNPGWNLAAGISAQQLQQNALAQQYFQTAWLSRQQLPQASQQFLQQQRDLMK